MTRPTIVSTDEAVAAIESDHTVAVGGTGHLLQTPDGLLAAIQRRCAAGGGPAGLTVVHTMGLGDNVGAGMDRLAAPGLVRRFVGSHYGHNPPLMTAIGNGDVEAFGIPGGVLSQLYREIAGGRPGVITKVGLDTYVDPRVDGGRLNDQTPGSIADVIELADTEWLFYPAFPIDIGLIRATTADTDGNLTMEDEAGFGDNLALAAAVRNSGGKVIAEVKRITEAGRLSPQDVKVPGILVDAIAVVPDQRQTGATAYSPYRSGSLRAPDFEIAPLPPGVRKLIARRAADELRSGDIVNLGFGISTGIGAVLSEEGVYDQIIFSIEQGVIGGVPGDGLNSGTAINSQAFIDAGTQFDLYDGGILDVCSVSFGEVDVHGNVNVSRLGDRAVGPGGFINISQNAKRVIFCGTFTGGGLQTDYSGGSLRIRQEGRYRKFVDSVRQITFAPRTTLAAGRSILFITERAVFRLTDQGMELTEIAEGVNIERDVLAQMDFQPLVSPHLKKMDPRLMGEGRIGMPHLEQPR